MNTRKNNGITLIALVITIIVLLIISGISIGGTIKINEQAKDSVAISELNMIQHAILERYTKSKLTHEELPGTNIAKTEVEKTIQEINNLANTNISLKGNDGNYKELSKTDLENLGITDEKDIYIVNYKTGEVINKTQKVTNKGKALYVYSVEE